MGGTYKLSNYKDRDSEYPARRKLIKNPSAGDDVYTVQRFEGEIREQGITFSADTMNALDKKIYDMFPVSIEDGGTGATNTDDALNNLGIGIKSGSFTPVIKNDNPLANEITYTFTNPSNPGDLGYNQGNYYRMGYFCYVSFALKVWVTGTGKNGGENAYIRIDGLPYNSALNIEQALTVGECSSLGGVLNKEGGLMHLDKFGNSVYLEEPTGQLAQWFENTGNWAWIRGSGVYICNPFN